MRDIPQIALDFVARVEALRLKAYRDSKGVATIGYGHTEGVMMGATCSKADAVFWLKADLRTARDKLYGVLKAAAIEALTEHQWAALLSFVFNLGAKPGWTIWKRVNAGSLDLVAGELVRFVYMTDEKTGQPVKVQGLVNRRAEEVKLWSTDEPGTVVAAVKVSSGVTNSSPTPPQSLAAKPIEQSKTIWTAGGMGAAGLVTGAQYVQSVVAPQAANHALLAKLAGVAAVMIVLGSLAIGLFRWLDQRSKHV